MTRFDKRPTTTGFIYDSVTGRNLARLDSDGDIYFWYTECETERKIGTATRDGKVYSLDGEFTGQYLRELHM
jgi:hypothetical protein